MLLKGSPCRRLQRRPLQVKSRGLQCGRDGKVGPAGHTCSSGHAVTVPCHSPPDCPSLPIAKGAAPYFPVRARRCLASVEFQCDRALTFNGCCTLVRGRCAGSMELAHFFFTSVLARGFTRKMEAFKGCLGGKHCCQVSRMQRSNAPWQHPTATLTLLAQP